MWTKRKRNFYPVDSKIVKNDFIIAEGSASGYSFLDKDENPFHRDLFAPIFYIFKVHKNHPMRILSPNHDYVDIYPAYELNKKNPRAPARVYEDKMDYDLATFLFLPHTIDNDKVKSWDRFYIKGGFINNNDERVDACLLYLKYGTSLNSQDPKKVSEVMPSQIIDHFNSWLYEDNKKIYSHVHKFNQKLEGRIDVPLETARELTAKIMSILEKRYKTKLVFHDYRKAYKQIFNQI